MPTGYTAGVEDGTVKTFEEYALQCARAFGACIELRDAPLSAEIPEFVPSNYHKEQLEKSRARRKELFDLAATEVAERCAAFNAEALRSHIDCVEANEVTRRRYAEMLEKARAFVAPTADHAKYAEFLVSQLTESMEFDLFDHKKPEPLDPDAWIEMELSQAQRDIEYHAKQHAAEVARVADRNKWVAALREQLKKAPE